MSVNWKPLIPQNHLLERVKVMSRGVQAYIDESKVPVVVAIVTQGGIPFGIDLTKLLKPESFHWAIIGTGSYGAGEDGGKVNLQFNRCGDVSGKRVIIVDDIADRRATLKYLGDYFIGPEQALEVRYCVLLNKPSRKQCDVSLHWVGFEIPNVFVAGYGLDGGQGLSFTRNFPDVCYKEGTLPIGSKPYWLPE
jgi:hypoxanthine phosphoribosyltransferase